MSETHTGLFQVIKIKTTAGHRDPSNPLPKKYGDGQWEWLAPEGVWTEDWWGAELFPPDLSERAEAAIAELQEYSSVVKVRVLNVRVTMEEVEGG